MKLQMVGMKQALKTEPRNTLPDNHAKPSGGAQMLGTTVKLQSEASSVKYGAGTPDGTRQMVGEQVKMSSKPFSGWQSNDTPMSNRNGEQKKIY